MTAPTSDRAQRIERIASALDSFDNPFHGPNAAHDLATVLVDTLAPDTERLGGGEREVPPDTSIQFQAWSGVVDALSAIDGNWSVGGAAIDRAPAFIRTLAQTAKDATARAEAAERANIELDNARQSAEQSARDLRAENVHLRTQLDAMTGEQPSVKFVGYYGVTITVTHHKNGYSAKWGQDGERVGCTVDDLVRIWPMASEHRAALEALRHPSPAARVVGACVVSENPNHCTMLWTLDADQQNKEQAAASYAKYNGGTAYRLVAVGPALTPNADGAK